MSFGRIIACFFTVESFFAERKGCQTQPEKLFKWQMYVEIHIFYNGAVDHLQEILSANRGKFSSITKDKEEYILKQQGNSSEEWVLRIGPRNLYFTMDSCPSYERFIEVLESNLAIFSAVLTPDEIVSMGIRGNYLYPISSIQEFSQLACAWSGDYTVDKKNLVQINDIGVNVDFREGSLKVNIICEFLAREKAKEFFPRVSVGQISELNFFIGLNISTNEPLALQKPLAVLLGQSIKTHVLQATKLMEQRLEQAVKAR